jgi:hypothetical protein
MARARLASLQSPPSWIRPQLAQLVTEAPSGREWLHEIKYDGYRLHARLDSGKVQLLTRKGLDWTHKYPGTPPLSLAVCIPEKLVVPSERASSTLPSIRTAQSSPSMYALLTLSPAIAAAVEPPVSNLGARSVSDAMSGSGRVRSSCPVSPLGTMRSSAPAVSLPAMCQPAQPPSATRRAFGLSR